MMQRGGAQNCLCEDSRRCGGQSPGVVRSGVTDCAGNCTDVLSGGAAAATNDIGVCAQQLGHSGSHEFGSFFEYGLAIFYRGYSGVGLNQDGNAGTRSPHLSNDVDHRRQADAAVCPDDGRASSCG